MKKILLSLLALVALTVNAQTEFTWTCNDWTGITVDTSGTTPKVTSSEEISYTKDGFKLVAKKGEGTSSNPTVYWGGNDGTINDLRIYATSTLTVSNSKAITGLEFKVSIQGKKRLASITASVGKVTVDPTNWVVYWVGDASSVTFTVGEKATYGTDGATKAGQFDVDNAILYVDGAKPNVTSSDLQPSGLAYSQGSKTITLGTEYELPTLSNPNNLAVTYSSSKEEVATIDANGNVTIVGAGTCTIKATSEATDKYLAGSASYSLTVKEASQGDDDPKDEVAIPYEEPFSSNIGSFKIEDVTIPSELTYVWKWNSSKYMKASAYANSTNYATESWLISPVIDLTGATSPVLAFSQCVNKYFGDVDTEATVWVKENGGSWSQLAITFGEFPEGKNWSSWADNSISISKYAGKKVVVGFKYVSTASAAGTWEVKNFSVKDDSATGINAISASENAPVYNLAGQRVAAGYKGAVIMNGKKFIQK